MNKSKRKIGPFISREILTIVFLIPFDQDSPNHRQHLALWRGVSSVQMMQLFVCPDSTGGWPQDSHHYQQFDLAPAAITFVHLQGRESWLPFFLHFPVCFT